MKEAAPEMSAQEIREYGRIAREVTTSTVICACCGRAILRLEDAIAEWLVVENATGSERFQILHDSRSSPICPYGGCSDITSRDAIDFWEHGTVIGRARLSSLIRSPDATQRLGFVGDELRKADRLLAWARAVWGIKPRNGVRRVTPNRTG